MALKKGLNTNPQVGHQSNFELRFIYDTRIFQFQFEAKNYYRSRF